MPFVPALRLTPAQFIGISLPELRKCLFEIFLPGSVKLRTLSGCEKITQAT
jgi:hypothetical protein